MATLRTAIGNMRAIIGVNNDVAITWDVNPRTVIATDVFELRHGNSPSEMKVIAPVLDVNFYRHEKVNIFNKNTRHYYQITVKRLSNSVYVTIYESEIVPLNAEIKDPYAIEIQRRKTLVNKEYRKNTGFVLIRKTYGEKCPSCFDENYEASNNSHCTTCYGTSFKGGFFAKIPITYEVGQSEEQIVSTDIEKMYPKQKNFTVIGFPILSQGDIIVDRNLQKWRVEGKHNEGILNNNIVG